jgi:hypothetical protein
MIAGGWGRWVVMRREDDKNTQDI